jgi:uncharacterized protein YyaL (SSP411 family)
MTDTIEGGFGGAPKFPQPVYLEFLLEASRQSVDEARRGTRSITACGTRSTGWRGRAVRPGGGRVPPVLRGWDVDGAALREDAVRQRASYEVERALADAGDTNMIGAAVEVYGLGRTNFQDPHHPSDGPKNVLRLEDRPDAVAKARGVSELELLSQLNVIHAALRTVRDERDQPHTDDKALASWNGMMITAMLDGHALLGDEIYAEYAERATAFILERMRREDGTLARDWRDGRTTTDGVLEDHACVLRALLAMHAAGIGSGPYLDDARALADAIETRFGDGAGGYFDTREGTDDLFVRPRTFYDGAIPSGGSTLLNAFVTFARIDPEGPWKDRAIALARSLSSPVAEQPVSAINATRGVLRLMRLGADAAAAIADAPGPKAAPAGSASRQAPQPVEVYADAERVTVTEDAPGEVNLVVRIAEGYHVLAAEPVSDSAQGKPMPELMPLRVGLVSGQGVAVYADYPTGEPYGAAMVGSDDLRVHTGDLELRIAIERAEGIGPTPGRPILGLTLQACTDTACLEPKTFELDVAIDLG